MRASGINKAFMQARSLSAGPVIAASSTAGMPSGSEGNAQPASGACANAFPAYACARVAVIASTAKLATLTITLHTDLFIPSPAQDEGRFAEIEFASNILHARGR